jgi:hypothetical protein
MTPPIEILPHPHTQYEVCPGGCKDIDVVAETIGKTLVELAAFEKRLQANHDELLRFETRLDEGGARMGRIEVLIADNSTTMGRNTSDTAEILSIMRESQVAFRLIEKAGNVLKWVFGIAAPLVAIYFAFKDHVK